MPMLVYHRPVEKANSIVLLRKNVSLVVRSVILPSVTMMVSVVVMRAVSVVTVPMVVLMTKTSVVSSDESRLSVAMMIVVIINQVHAVFLQNDGTQKQMVEWVRVSSAPILRPHLNSRKILINHISRVMEMVTMRRHTIDTS